MTNTDQGRIVRLAQDCEHALRLAAYHDRNGNLSAAADRFEDAEWCSQVAFLIAAGQRA